ncbi:DUF397 domain-containing protein [Micromonospora sp. FIMYZ51]|uniref:DUF397 domain-containing protein n=1 Tax=Micromonospora sp. FIMYZ51 TaxID=3051832 RepID=UPI00311DFD1C
MQDGWFKSSKSGPNCDNCVEVNADLGGSVGIRDSKDRSGPVLMVAPLDFAAFVRSAARGKLTPA